MILSVLFNRLESAIKLPVLVKLYEFALGTVVLFKSTLEYGLLIKENHPSLTMLEVFVPITLVKNIQRIPLPTKSMSSSSLIVLTLKVPFIT